VDSKLFVLDPDSTFQRVPESTFKRFLRIPSTIFTLSKNQFKGFYTYTLRIIYFDYQIIVKFIKLLIFYGFVVVQ
jgi:hypothetical protein